MSLKYHPNDAKHKVVAQSHGTPATLLCRRRHCARWARCDTGAILGTGTGDQGARVAQISYVAWDPNADLLCLASSETKVTKYKIPLSLGHLTQNIYFAEIGQN